MLCIVPYFPSRWPVSGKGLSWAPGVHTEWQPPPWAFCVCPNRPAALPVGNVPCSSFLQAQAAGEGTWSKLQARQGGSHSTRGQLAAFPGTEHGPDVCQHSRVRRALWPWSTTACPFVLRAGGCRTGTGLLWGIGGICHRNEASWARKRDL